MRFDIYLTVESSRLAIKFYVEELGLFEVCADYGMNGYLLCAKKNPHLCLQIMESEEKRTSISPRLGISVPSCDLEFHRLQKLGFTTGAHLVPDENGNLEVFEWPGGKNILVEDPSGNRFILFEDRIAPSN
jgi:hypothetical protein